MAQFDANINLRLNAKKVERDLKKIEQRVQKLNSRVASVDKRNAGPASNLITGRQADAAREVEKIERRRLKQIKEQQKAKDKQLEKDIRLAAVLQRQETLVRSINRAGTSGARKERVDELVKGAKQVKDSIRLQQAVNVQLEKELQTQREINRTDAAQATIARKNKVGAELDQRVAKLRAIGAEEQKLLKIEQERLELGNLNSRKNTDLARAKLAEVEGLIKELETLNKAALKRPQDVPGTPENKQKAKEALAEGVARSAAKIQRASIEDTNANSSFTRLFREAEQIRQKFREQRDRDADKALQDLKKQQIEQAKLDKALQALNQRSATALQEKLNINRLITNQKTLQAQRAKEAETTGRQGGRPLSLPIPQPLRNAQSFGFPVALPETKQEGKIRAQERARAEAKVALERQKSNSLLADGVSKLRLQLNLIDKLATTQTAFNRVLAEAQEIQRKEKLQTSLPKQNEKRLQEINKLNTTQENKERIKEKLFESGAALRKKEVDLADKLGKEVDQLLEAERDRLKVSKLRQAELKKEIAAQDRLNAKAAKERELEANKRKGASKKQLDGLLAAVGFPLLFGGGPGSVIGGALGSLVGGFGASIAASAVGQQLDRIIVSLADFGKSLSEVTGFAEVATQKLLLSSRAREKELKTLQELGFDDLADALAKLDIIETIGQGGVDNLEKLDEEFDQLARSVSILAIRVGAFIAGPLAKVIELLGNLPFTPSARDIAQRAFDTSKATDIQEAIKKAGAKTLKEQGKVAQEVAKKYKEELTKQIEAIKKEDGVTRLTQDQKALAFTRARRAVGTEPNVSEDASQRIQGAKLNLELNLLNRTQQIRDLKTSLEDAVTDVAKKQQSFDEQRKDLVIAAEEAVANTRLAVERRVADIRLQNIRRANAVLDQEARNRLQKAQLDSSVRLRQLRERQSDAGVNPELASIDQEAARAAEEVALAEVKAAQDAAKIKRDTAVEVVTLEVENERFKIDTARGIAALQTRTAKSIERINKNIAETNRQVSKEDFELKKLIAVVQLKIQSNELKILEAKLRKESADALKNLTFETSANDALSVVETLRGELDTLTQNTEDLERPASLNAVAPVNVGGVSTDAFDPLTQRGTDIINQGAALRQQEAFDRVSESVERQVAGISNTIIKIQDQVTRSKLQQIRDSQLQARTQELVLQGLTDESAQRIANLELTKQQQIAELQRAKAAALKAKDEALNKNDFESVVKFTRQIKRADRALGNLNDDYAVLIKAATETKLDAFIKQLEVSLADTDQQIIDLASTIQGVLANAISSTISGLVDGTKTIEESFADLFAGIGKAFLDLAATILAQKLVLTILNAFNPGGTSFGADKFNLTGFGNLNGGNAFPINAPKLFADGGRPPVGETSIVGERGPELFVPDSAGTVLPNEFFQAAQAALLKPGTLAATEEGDPNQAFFNQNRNAISNVTNTVKNRVSTNVSEGPTTTMTSPMTDSTIRFESMMIGNMEVVTKDEAEEIGQRSAAAARASVFNDLQNKPSIRRKLGMS